MAISDPVGDMITRIRNALMRGKTDLKTPASRLRAGVLDVLVEEGYIQGYTRTDFPNGAAQFDIMLKYHNGAPAIHKIERVSKPGRRVYASLRRMPVFYNGLGISVLSTPKGVMSDGQARQNRVGGEILCRVF